MPPRFTGVRRRHIICKELTMLSTLARPYFIAAHTLSQWAITLRLAVTSQTAKDLYKTLWIVAQVAFWMTVLAALYTRQAGRWFRAYYQAEWADTVQSILIYPDRCIDASPALTSTADSSSEHPGEGDEALPENVASILNSDRTSTAKLRALALASTTSPGAMLGGTANICSIKTSNRR